MFNHMISVATLYIVLAHWTFILVESKLLYWRAQKLNLPFLIFYLRNMFYPHVNILLNKRRQWPTWCKLALFYNTSTTILYMFRALHTHHQEVELFWCSIWYRHSQSVAIRWTGWERTALQFSLTLFTGWPLTERSIPDAAPIQFNLLMMNI